MRITALVKRIMLQMFRDKRTLALLFLAPLLVLTLMYLIFDSNEEEMTLGVVGGNDMLIETLETQGIQVEDFESADSGTVLENSLDGLLEIEADGTVLTLENDDPAKAKALLAQISQILALQGQGSAEQNTSSPALETD